QIQVDKIYVTVGGGGLISGIASVLKTLKPEIEIIGCQPKNSPEMYLSIAKGEIITEDNFPSTISDGSAGGLEIDAITFPLCQQLIDRFILIPEKQIEEAIKLAWDNDQERIEGAAGVALAAAMNDTEAKQDCKKLAIICGGNIDESLFQKIIQ
ncbi:MAG: pyridoxal-phosphate dependent enzyme, partial [Bacteroidota bacterium]